MDDVGHTLYPRQANNRSEKAEGKGSVMYNSHGPLHSVPHGMRREYSENSEIISIPTSQDGTASSIYVHTPRSRIHSSKKRRRDFEEDDCSCCESCCACWGCWSHCGGCIERLCYLLGLQRFYQRVWCINDVCGIVCAIFTWFLIFYGQFVSIYVLLTSMPSTMYRYINGTIFHMASMIAFISHLRAMFTDPGSVPLNNATRENILQMGFKDGQVVYKCPKCCSIKPDRAHHCSVCRRCIRKMDHHCPWINNCVGEANQKYFILFTAYICFISFYSIYMSIHFLIVCLRSQWHECHENGFSPAASTILVVFLIVEGILFGLFTAVMCGDQMQAVWNDTTGIESLKKEKNTWERRSRWLSMEVVFGHPFSWRWLLPVSPYIQRQLNNVWPLHIV